MNKKGVSQVVSVVLLITLVIAMAVTFGYIYTNFLYSQQDAIEGTVFEEIGLEGAGGCNPNYAPGEWSKCEVTYNLDDLVEEELTLEGTKSRVLEDLNKCAPNKLETEKCSTKELVSLKKVEKCSKKYLEIRDQDNKLVSRVELSDSKELTIEFLLGDIEYCSYCYNGIKDFDEDGVDCVNSGDSCPTCS